MGQNSNNYLSFIFLTVPAISLEYFVDKKNSIHTN